MNQDISRYMVSLETLEPFRIGALKDPLRGAKSPLAKIGEQVVVPGSSLKGALRAELEGYLIKNYASEGHMKPCIPSAFNTLSEVEKRLINQGKYKKEGSCVYSKKKKSDDICPVCYLLGAQGVVGFVRVPYLYTEDSAGTLYAVRIDRAAGVVSEGTNREYPTMPHGTKFESKVNGVEIPLEIITRDRVKGWEIGKIRP